MSESAFYISISGSFTAFPITSRVAPSADEIISILPNTAKGSVSYTQVSFSVMSKEMLELDARSKQKE